MGSERYYNCCKEVVAFIKNLPLDSKKNIEAIYDIIGFVEKQIKVRKLDRNEYIDVLIPYVESNMGIWERGILEEDDLLYELSLLKNDQPAPSQQPCQHDPDAEEVFRQRLSPILDEKQLTLLLSQLPKIKCHELKRLWFVKYEIKGIMNCIEFFDLCAAVVPHRKGSRGWNSKRFQDC